MSTQDPYGTNDPSRDERRGSSPDPGYGPSGDQYGQPQGQPYGQQPQQGYDQGPSQQPAAYGQGHPQQGYAGYGGSPAKPRNGLGLAALICGVIALLFSWTVVAGLLGLVAVVLGFIGSGRAKRGEATNRGVAITGIVLGVVSVLVAAAVLAFGIFVGSRAANCTDLANSGATEQEIQECIAGQFGVDPSQLQDS